MKHEKCIILMVLLVLVQVLVYAGDDSEKFNNSLKKWREVGIKHYNIKVEYRSFSPFSGIWEIEVKKGRVVSAKFNGITGENYLNFSERLTMESLYRTAESSLKAGNNSPVIILVEYDSENFFVKSVRRLHNPDYKGRIKKNAAYHIRVLEFHPLK
ncbi:MAG TPA: DUF6174 domain-containing protein [Spirochaetota bacterium]|nr:DUF6174 domain-containing protein [Spirochaetota bacterium]